MCKPISGQDKDAQTRVRTKGQNHNRTVGNMIWSEFVHLTSRPIENNMPDPHLHAHCTAMNVVFDKEEDRFKAMQIGNIYSTINYYQAIFHKVLANQVMDLGYGLYKNRLSFDLCKIHPELIDLFSKRQNEIEEVAKELDMLDPEQKATLGAKTRSAKDNNKELEELIDNWQLQTKESQVSQDGKETNPKARYVTDKMCLDYALDHCLSHYSAVPERDVIGKALHYGVESRHITLESIEDALAQDDRVILRKSNDGLDKLTTKEVLAEEKRMVDLARNCKGRTMPIAPHLIDQIGKNSEFPLKVGQVKAAHHILTSTDGVMMVEGLPGTGKTTLLKDVVPTIESTGRQIYFFAPSAKASRVALKEKGFENAETIRMLFDQPMRQEALKNQVMVVDESGMIGTKDMLRLLEIRANQNAKLLLIGDTRQHNSPTRGDAMRQLKEIAKLQTPQLNEIVRQKQETYRQAVEHISSGEANRISQGMAVLDKMGAIEETEWKEGMKELAKIYLKNLNKGEHSIIVSPKNHQCEQLTVLIRQALKNEGRIDETDHSYTVYKNLQWTEAEKQDRRNYRTGQVIQTNQNIKGILKGTRMIVEGHENDQVVVRTLIGKKLSLPLTEAKKFDVCQQKTIEVAKGDTLRITHNGKNKQKQHMTNGTILTVQGFDQNGNILTNRFKGRSRHIWVVDRDFGNFDHSQCMTSYASQAQEDDHVLIYQTTASFPATNRKQANVSISRGIKSIKIYTDNKEALLEKVLKPSDRLSAIDLNLQKNTNETQAHINQVQDRMREQTSKDWGIDYQSPDTPEPPQTKRITP